MPPTPKTRHIRIVIADDHSLVRDGLRRLLEAEEDFQVVGEAADGEETVARVTDTLPDILLLDLKMPRVSGMDALRRLGSLLLATRTILLAADADPQEIEEAMRLGAWGVVLKRAATRELLKSIRCVMQGEYWVDRATLAGIIRARTEGEPPQRPLTQRELELIEEVRTGSSNREIGHKFSISEETVKRHLANIFEKLGVGSRVELAVYATTHHLSSGHK